MKSDPHDLRRRKSADRYLHLIAFVVHQYFALQDNLVATFLSSVKTTETAASRELKDWCHVERKSQAARLRAQIQAFEDHFQSAMATLRGVFEADNLTDADKLERLHLLLFPVDAEPVLSDTILKDMKDDASLSQSEDARYYDILEAKSPAKPSVGRTAALSRFLPQKHYVPICEILNTVHVASGFADSLSYLRQQYARPVSTAVLLAGVIGLSVVSACGKWPAFPST